MFKYCVQLNSIVLPDSLKYIDSYAFQNTGLSSISIPDKVSSIGVSAFSDCSNLQSVTFGKSVKFIGQHAFNNCSNLQTIISRPYYPPVFRTNVFTNYNTNVNLGAGYTDYACGDIPTSTIIHIVCGKTSWYQSWWYTTNYTFVEDMAYELFVFSSDSTMGIAQILQSPACSQDAIIEAQAYSGYHFVRWNDNNTDNPRILSMTTDASYTAIFEVNSVSTNALMKMDSNIATLYALPQVGVQFRGWSDGAIENPHIVTVTSDTTINAIYSDLDSVRIYDTMIVYDTVINVMRDTTVYNHYFFDSVMIYDTLVVYDTMRVFDTLTIVNIDTLYHYYYDTTVVQSTIYDTTHVFDTLIIVNIDTINHHYNDTIYVFDTLTVTNVDTLHHYYYDTTIIQNTIHDTLTVTNVDTLHHYYYDTTVIQNTLYDTTSITHYIFDSTWVFDTIYLIDTIHVHDTVYIEVQGIENVETANVKVYTNHAQIVVEGADGMSVSLYDINGRKLEFVDKWHTTHVRFEVPTSGSYLIRIGERTVKKVVVVR